jgi:methyltransferase-like protein
LDETNQPLFLHQFIDRAAAHGLRYLAEAEPWTTAAAQPSVTFQAFGETVRDWLAREQLFDLIQGRAFRHAVLCREGISCSRVPSAQALLSLRMTSLVRPSAARPALRPDGAEDFQNSRGKLALTTTDPVFRAALRILDEARPRSVPFEILWARVQERLASSGEIAVPGGPAVAGSGEAAAASRQRLAEAMLDAFSHHVIELHVHEPGFTAEIGEFPRASPVARRQAVAGPRVVNLRHRVVALMDFERFLLPHLDGRHDRRALLAAMQEAVKKGVFTARFQGQTITASEAAVPILARFLEEGLQRLAAAALLVG